MSTLIYSQAFDVLKTRDLQGFFLSFLKDFLLDIPGVLSDLGLLSRQYSVTNNRVFILTISHETLASKETNANGVCLKNCCLVV